MSRKIGVEEIKDGLLGVVIHLTQAIQEEKKCSVNEAKADICVFLNDLSNIIKEEINGDKGRSSGKENPGEENICFGESK